MNLDTLVIRLMNHGRTLKSRIEVTEEGEVITDRSVCVRPGSDGESVEIVRVRRDNEGGGSILKRVPLAEALDAARSEMDDLDALMRRERALTANAYTADAPPSWSLCADRLGISLLKGIGMEPREAINPMDAVWTRTPGRMERVMQHPRLSDGLVMRHGGRCDLRMTVHVDTRGSAGTGTMWYHDAQDGAPHLNIATRTSLPETTMSAAIGKPLVMIMAIPGVGAEIVVRRMTCHPDGALHLVRIETDPMPTRLLRAPEGVDTSWLRAA